MITTQITDRHQMLLPILLEIWEYPDKTGAMVFLANTEGQGIWLDCDDYEDAKTKLAQAIEVIGRAEHDLQEMGWGLASASY